MLYIWYIYPEGHNYNITWLKLSSDEWDCYDTSDIAAAILGLLRDVRGIPELAGKRAMTCADPGIRCLVRTSCGESGIHGRFLHNCAGQQELCGRLPYLPSSHPTVHFWLGRHQPCLHFTTPAFFFKKSCMFLKFKLWQVITSFKFFVLLKLNCHCIENIYGTIHLPINTANFGCSTTRTQETY